MILSDREILKLQELTTKRGYPLLNPFNKEQLGPSSYDLRWSGHALIPNFSPDIVITASKPVEARYKEFDGHTLILGPHEFVLMSTEEYVVIPTFITAQVWNRSSLMRLGISVRGDAGYIDPGFHGHITLEVKNNSNAPIKFKKGDKIAQLVFYRMTSASIIPYTVKGRYAGSRKTVPSKGI